MTTAKDLRIEYKRKLKALQKKCQHPDVEETYRSEQVPAFYEMDRPGWLPEYYFFDIYQCKVCRAYLKPNKRKDARRSWLPGNREGYCR